MDGEKGRVATKPHGHGDVHDLLHRAGLAKGWAARGIRYVSFFQDTNALLFRSVQALTMRQTCFGSSA